MNEIGNMLLGGALAIAGSVVSDMYQEHRNKKNELEGIKTSLSDELHDIKKILASMQVVWDKTKTLIPSDLDDLKRCTMTYDEVRPKLYLIKNEKIRNELRSFYNELKNSINSNYKRAGSLSQEKEAIEEQEKIAEEFKSYQERVDSLISKLK